MLNINNKIPPLPIWRYASKHSCYLDLHNSNKQQLIPAKFYTKNVPLIGNQTTKFQLNLHKQTIAIAASARSPQDISVSSLCG